MNSLFDAKEVKPAVLNIKIKYRICWTIIIMAVVGMVLYGTQLFDAGTARSWGVLSLLVACVVVSFLVMAVMRYNRPEVFDKHEQSRRQNR